MNTHAAFAAPSAAAERAARRAARAEIRHDAGQLWLAIEHLTGEQAERADAFAESEFGVGARGLYEDVLRFARDGMDATSDLAAVLAYAKA